jgi:hypothetical protein
LRTPIPHDTCGWVVLLSKQGKGAAPADEEEFGGIAA